MDGSQRANVWWYVVPAVEGNAENLNKILISAKHVRFFSHWRGYDRYPQCGMNLWARIRQLHQYGNVLHYDHQCASPGLGPPVEHMVQGCRQVQPSPTQLCSQRYAIRCAASCKRNTAGTTCGTLFAKYRAAGFARSRRVALSREISAWSEAVRWPCKAVRRNHRLHQMRSLGRQSKGRDGDVRSLSSFHRGCSESCGMSWRHSRSRFLHGGETWRT